MKLPRVGKLPRLGASRLISQWMLALLALSIIASFDGGFLASRFALIPSRVWLGDIWRLLTWPMVEPGVMTLILTCAALYKLGNDLAVRWGDVRLQRFAIRVLLGAGVMTVIVATLFGASRMGRLGGWAVADVLTIAWARQFPTVPLMMYGVALNGERLVRVVLGVNVLFAIFLGPLYFLPELSACVLAMYYPQSWLRRR